MNEPQWEDQLQDLHRLADQVSAPASFEAREAIHRRAGVLRRRRQVRRTVAAGALVVLLIAGILALQRGGRADLETGPAEQGDEGSLPALTVDLDGWRVVEVVDSRNAPWDSASSDIEPGMEGSFQVFRRPGWLDGPTVMVRHVPATDAVGQEEGEESIPIGDGTGYLREVLPGSFTLSWAPSNGDSHANLQAYGLPREDVVEFAAGLRPKDDTISGFPADPDDEFGFEATFLPDQIEEDPVGRLHELADVRQVDLERGSSWIQIQINSWGEMAFESNLAERLLTDGSAEEVSVLGRPALLFGPTDQRWTLIWRQGEAAAVELAVAGVDRSAVDEIIAGLREVSDDEWRELVAQFQ